MQTHIEYQMDRRLLGAIILLFSALAGVFFLGCKASKKLDETQPAPAVTEKPVDLSIHNFQTPEESQPDLCFQRELAPGGYKISSIRVTFVSTDSKYAGSKWTFIHQLSTLGIPKSGDEVRHQRNWVKPVNSGDVGPSTLSLQIPMNLQVMEDGSFQYGKTQHYGLKSRGDSTWAWSSLAEVKEGRDVAIKLASKKDLDGVLTKIEIDGGIDHSKKVQGYQWESNRVLVATRFIRPHSFVLINFFETKEAGEVYTEVTYQADSGQSVKL